MTTKLEAAARQALEALEILKTDVEWLPESPTLKMLKKAITALRKALAEQANEPDWKAEAVALRVNEQNLIAALERACNTAMEQALIARIPECGRFAGIAQDLDWVLDQMPATIRARGNT